MKSSVVLTALLFATAQALAYQDPLPVRKAIDDFLRAQIKALSEDLSYTIGSIDPGNQLPSCASFLVRHDGARLWGRINLTVQCQTGANWSIFVPVQIKQQGNYLVARRNLSAGQTLSEADLEVRRGDITEFPGNLIESPQQALGKTLNASLTAGQALRSNVLRLPLVVQQGQRVTLVSRGEGFSVSSEGQALNNAGENQVVRVRLPNGQVVNGLAQTGGIVEINH